LAQQVEAALKAGAELEAPPIVPVSRETNLPLSFAQQRLWFIDRLGPNTALYNIPLAMSLTGELNVEALRYAVDEVIRRHESLRTTFAAVEGQPRQIIQPPQRDNLIVVDLSQFSEQERANQTKRWIAEEARRPFDLGTGPLLRVTLLKQEEQQHVLLMTVHHIVFDGWSLGVLVQEVAALYNAFHSGQLSQLPELTIQYADFAHWQRTWLQGEVLEQQMSYWKDRLAGAPALLELPADHARPAVQSFRGAYHSFNLSPELTEQLQQLSSREGATLFMTLLAAFNVLLYRYSQQTDILVGSPIAGRNRSETEKLIGFFVNTLVLRTRVKGDESFSELLQQVREVCLGAYAHQDLPFEKLVEELEPERSLSHTPLFQVWFVLQNAPLENLELSDLQLDLLSTNSATAKFDLYLSLVNRGGRLAGFFEYSSDLFDASTISRMAEHFKILLQEIVAQPEQFVAKLPLLSEAERTQLVSEYNETAIEYETTVCLHQMFERQAQRVPNNVAVVFEDQEMTYAELNARANQLAHYLRGLGVGPEVLVAVLMERSLEMMVGLLGILKAGGAYVPLDPAYPTDRLTFMLKDSHAGVLLVQAHLLENFQDCRVRTVLLDRDRVEIAQESEENSESGVRAENLAYVIYTSGSTGRPKGAMNTHLAICNRLLWMQDAFALGVEDRVLQKTPTSFDVSVWELFWPLLTGARLVLAEPGGHRDSGYLWEVIRREQITTLHFVPSMLNVFLEEGAASESGLSGVRRVICSGEALSHETQERFFALGGKTELHNLYGPTEAAVDVTWWACERGSERRVVPIGKPVANTQCYVLDQWGGPVPVGVSGELYLGGVQVGRGYGGRPELTAESFVPDAYGAVSGGRLYRTGDLVRRLEDGNLEYLGRLDHQVKLRGHRIELGEIEAMFDEHPAVNQAVVVLKDDPAVGQCLVAYIVPHTHNELLEEPSAETSVQVEQLSQWKRIFERTYHEGPTRPDPTFNISGWNSSYTGEPIPEAEMHEWIDRTVERILALEPVRVLEIGCGLGLLLFRLAPHCRRYDGIDFSSSAINYVQQELQKLADDFSHVTVSQRAADDLDDLGERAFGAVVINSVIQYFPNAEYLLRVLERAVQAVDKGFVFVGDVRNLRLLKALHASVELYRASAALSVASLQERVQERLANEEELCIDPAFFEMIKQRLPRVSRVEIQLKRGRYHNEMSRFRYDVVLHVGAEAHSLANEVTLNWQSQNLDLSRVRQLLADDEPEVLRLERVPNARLRSVVEAVKLLESADCPKLVGELREALSGTVDKGIEVEDVWAMRADLPYTVEVGWSDSGNDACFDVVFRRTSKVESSQYRDAVVSDRSHAFDALERFASNPSQSIFNSRVASQLRAYAKEKLPEYMAPSYFVLLRNFPLTPNGKVDRRALPSPRRNNLRVKDTFIAPRDVLELRLTHLWEDLLNMKPIGVGDNFFEVGGHSMLAARMMAGVERLSGVKLPLNLIFQEPTIEGLARVLRKLSGTASKFSSLVEIQAGVSSIPFFCVHPAGGHVLCYAHLSRHLGAGQTLYGLQAQGLDGEHDPLTRIDEMATHYIDVMRSVQPEGPYLLGGWSMGGVVAYEMARQLQAQGHNIAMLALFDSNLPARDTHFEELDELVLLDQFARDLGISPEQLEISPEELMHIGQEERLNYVLDRAGDHDLLPPDIELSQMRHLFNIFKINVRAMLSYVPKPSPVPVTLFTVGESSANTIWNTLSPTQVNPVSGNHFTMMREPHVEVLAGKLKACLDARKHACASA